MSEDRGREREREREKVGHDGQEEEWPTKFMMFNGFLFKYDQSIACFTL